MIRTFLLYKIIDVCLDSFFDDLDTKLTPLVDIYSDVMMINDLKWAVARSDLKFIELYEGSLTIILLSRIILAKRKMNMMYEPILTGRIYRYFDDRYTRGDTRFGDVIILRMNLRVVTSPTKIMKLVHMTPQQITQK